MKGYANKEMNFKKIYNWKFEILVGINLTTER